MGMPGSPPSPLAAVARPAARPPRRRGNLAATHQAAADALHEPLGNDPGLRAGRPASSPGSRRARRACNTVWVLSLDIGGRRTGCPTETSAAPQRDLPLRRHAPGQSRDCGGRTCCGTAAREAGGRCRSTTCSAQKSPTHARRRFQEVTHSKGAARGLWLSGNRRRPVWGTGTGAVSSLVYGTGRGAVRRRDRVPLGRLVPE